MTKAQGPLLGMVKPSKRAAKSHAELLAMLPGDVRTVERFAPIQHGALEEFENVLPVYEQFVRELAGEGVDLIHVEGTPASFIMGHDLEQRTIARWQNEFNIPVFTSATCQANALRALDARKIVDAGYDPTTGPPAERYFRDAGFIVLAVEKAPIEWDANGDISNDVAFSMLASLVRRHPGAEALCLQGSSKWRLNEVIARLEDELNIVVVHPMAARYWELMHRLGRTGPRPGVGRLLASMPPLPTPL
ncbi:MAG: decarboxylase [Ramlibacter sp.]|jgi:maleate cis-trans isomerase|nr:decarboxylase [Ramlibacter sp.]